MAVAVAVGIAVFADVGVGPGVCVIVAVVGWSAVSGVPSRPAAVTREVILTLETAVRPEQAVTLSYTPGFNPIQDNTSNAAAALIGQTVTNVAPPSLTSATVNGGALTLTYDTTLNAASVPAPGDFRV